MGTDIRPSNPVPCRRPSRPAAVSRPSSPVAGALISSPVTRPSRPAADIRASKSAAVTRPSSSPADILLSNPTAAETLASRPVEFNPETDSRPSIPCVGILLSMLGVATRVSMAVPARRPSAILGVLTMVGSMSPKLLISTPAAAATTCDDKTSDVGTCTFV